MKATIEVPDDLYRQVKAKSALRGQAVREVVMSLFQSWIEEGEPVASAPSFAAHQSPPAWFGGARKYARQVRRHDLTAVRASIARGRGREAAAEPASAGRS
jgi:hypothetical protein